MKYSQVLDGSTYKIYCFVKLWGVLSKLMQVIGLAFIGLRIVGVLHQACYSLIGISHDQDASLQLIKTKYISLTLALRVYSPHSFMSSLTQVNSNFC